MGTIFMLMTRTSCGCNLLLKVRASKYADNCSNYTNLFFNFTNTDMSEYILLQHPSLFSWGFVSREGPDPKVHEEVRFSITFKALGWTQKLAVPTDKHTNPPNKTMITKVSGISPAYNLTSSLLVLSAITILKESDKMPDK